MTPFLSYSHLNESQRKWWFGCRYLPLLLVTVLLAEASSQNFVHQIRFIDHFVDPALGFCAGWAYFLNQAISLPFEIVAFNLVLQYWTNKIPVEAMTSALIVIYV